jgi:hypothetical protein
MNKASYGRCAPSMGWRCDSCGELITSIESGWVEWLAGADEHGKNWIKGLRLVHSYCRYDDRREFRKDHSLVEGTPREICRTRRTDAVVVSDRRRRNAYPRSA